MLQEDIDLVKRIDKTLNLSKKLTPSSLRVFKVEKDAAEFVLKAAINYDWGIAHIKREAEILRTAQGVPGITQLVKTYGDHKNSLCLRLMRSLDFVWLLERFNMDYTAILKEYFPGESLCNLPSDQAKIGDAGTQKKLESAVRYLHNQGIAMLDIAPKNIVISPDRTDACMVDLGYGKYRRDEKASDFEYYKKHDLLCLEHEIFR